MNIIIHTDGGARGNPGPAAVGVVIEIYKSTNEESANEHSQADKTVEFGKVIGETTNNVAEYTAVIEALTHLHEILETTNMPPHRVYFYLDSTLVVNQINGVFKVKDAKLRELLFKVHALEKTTNAAIQYTAVPREQNRRADFFVNKALDERL